MNFMTLTTNAQKKSAYLRAISDTETSVYRMIIENGFNPDSFDETTFSPAVDGNGAVLEGHKLLRDSLDNLEKMKAALEKLS